MKPSEMARPTSAKRKLSEFEILIRNDKRRKHPKMALNSAFIRQLTKWLSVDKYILSG